MFNKNKQRIKEERKICNRCGSHRLCYIIELPQEQRIKTCHDCFEPLLDIGLRAWFNSYGVENYIDKL